MSWNKFMFTTQTSQQNQAHIFLKRNDYLRLYRSQRILDPHAELFRSRIARKSFIYMGTSLWPKVHNGYCGINDIKLFVKKYKRYLMAKYSNILEVWCSYVEMKSLSRDNMFLLCPYEEHIKVYHRKEPTCSVELYSPQAFEEVIAKSSHVEMIRRATWPIMLQETFLNNWYLSHRYR